MTSELPAPAVPADAYDEEYYRRCCGGHEEWSASEGSGMADIYAGMLRRASFRDGEVLVDIGTGRGELLALAVELGAKRAYGIEYSEDALALAHKTLEAHGATERAEAVLADARAIPLDDGIADLVTMIDVVEHLAPTELDGSLREAYRLLRPGGRILIHTFPTSTIRKVYGVQRRMVPGRAKRWPADPRLPVEVLMHVNEQTPRRLQHSLEQAGFRASATLGEWVWPGYVPESEPRARRLYSHLARFRPTKRFGVANLFGEGVKP